MPTQYDYFSEPAHKGIVSCPNRFSIMMAEIEATNRMRDKQLLYTSNPCKTMKLWLDSANGTFAISGDIDDAFMIFAQAGNCELVVNLHTPNPVELHPNCMITFWYETVTDAGPLRYFESHTSDEWARSNTRGVIGLLATRAIIGGAE